MTRDDGCSAWLSSAMDNFAKSRLYEASADCLMALLRCPEHPEALAMLAGARIIMSRGRDGYALLDRAAAAGPANPVVFAISRLVQNTLATIIDQHIAERRLADAAGILAEGRGIAHCFGRPWAASPLHARQAALVSALQDAARAALGAGNAAACAENVRELLAIEPEHPEGLALAVRAEHARGDVAAALEWAAKATPAARAAHIPGHVLADIMVRIRLVLAEALRGERLDEVASICDCLLRIDPDLEVAKLCKIEVGNVAPVILQRMHQEGEQQKALDMAMRLRRLDPGNPGLADVLGRLVMVEPDLAALCARLPAPGAPRPGSASPAHPGFAPPVRQEWRPPTPPSDDLNACIHRIKYYYSFGSVPDHFMYSHGATIVEWLNLPGNLVLNTEFMHSTGVSTLTTTLDMARNGKIKGPYLVFNKRLKQELERYGVECHLMGTPYVHFRRMRQITPAPDAAGTLACPCPLPHDKDTFIDRLLALDEQFHPITVSLTPHQIQEGEHLIYARRGIRVVTAGHMYDPMFADNLYNILRNHKYTVSNGIATTFIISIEMGIPFFYIGDGLPLSLEDPLQVEAWKLISDNENRPEISPELAAFVKEVHGCDDPDIDRERLRWILWKDATG